MSDREVKALADVLFSLTQESWTTTTLAHELLQSDWCAQVRRQVAVEALDAAAVRIKGARPDVTAPPVGDPALPSVMAEARGFNRALAALRATPTPCPTCDGAGIVDTSPPGVEEPA